MRRMAIPIIVMMLFLPACNVQYASEPSGTAVETNRQNLCGDGVCSEGEKTAGCTKDCPPTQNPATEGPPSGERAPLFMTTMTHMEGSFKDDSDASVFREHIEQLTYGMDLADEYGAILTVESEQPFAKANKKWGRNFMAEILARGHGVGTHCDFGFHDAVMPVERYAAFFSENKALVDALVGAQNNLGCSGGGGANDWVRGAYLAGFKYIDGVVGMHYLSMPIANRPDPTWTDEFIMEKGYHINSPVDLYQRIYPFMVADASDFVPDDDGVILVSSGELGPLLLMAEGSAETGDHCPKCAYGTDDVDALATLIREVDRNRDPRRVAKLTLYFPAADFVPDNETILRCFFEQMKIFVDEGVVTWATQLQVYQAYMDWNS